MPALLGARIAAPPRKAWTYPKPTPAQVARLPDRKVMAVRHPIYDQYIGSCTLNSSNQGLVSMSGRTWIPSVNGAYYDARVYSGFPPHQDSGAYPEDVAKMLREVGLGSVSACPDDPATWQDKPSALYYQGARDHRVLDYYRAQSIDSLRAAIDVEHAVMIAMEVTESFFDMKPDGLWRRPTPRSMGGHQMWVYGYDDNLEAADGWGPGSFHVLQSWGVWGEPVVDQTGLGRASWRIPYQAIADGSAKAYDFMVYTLFDSTAGD